jgi:hypothetical protein
VKPHEENWIANVEWPIALVELAEDRDEVVATFDAPHSVRDVDRARALLAAQAPAMARCLIALLPGTAEPIWPDTLDEIEAVLRAAGVLS